MDANTGFVYALAEEREAQEGRAKKDLIGEKIAASEAAQQVLAEDWARLPGEQKDRLAEMEANGEDLVRVTAEAAQRARLGDRELRRRRQRRR